MNETYERPYRLPFLFRRRERLTSSKTMAGFEKNMNF